MSRQPHERLDQIGSVRTSRKRIASVPVKVEAILFDATCFRHTVIDRSLDERRRSGSSHFEIHAIATSRNSPETQYRIRSHTQEVQLSTGARGCGNVADRITSNSVHVFCKEIGGSDRDRDIESLSNSKRITTELPGRLKSFNAVLLLVALLGAALAWHTARQRARLTARRDELAQMVGDVAIADRTKLHVRAVETGEKLHFAWRIYVPPNFPLVLPMPGGGRVANASSGARDFIARIRFRRNENGELEVYWKLLGPNSVSKVGNKHLAELLFDRPDASRVEQLGRIRARHADEGPIRRSLASDVA